MKPARRAPTYLLAALAAACCLHALAAEPAPPVAPRQDVVDLLHGVSVPDPYRALEEVKSPGTQAWLAGQGAYGEAVLSHIEGRQAITDRILALSSQSGDQIRQIVRLPGEGLMYLKRAKGENQFKLVLRSGLKGAEKVLVDPGQLSKTTGVPHAINYFMPSWDGRMVAYGLSAGGSEDASLSVMSVDTGKVLSGPIPRVHEALVHWTPDNQALTYNQVRELAPGTPDTETYLDSTVFLLRVGDSAEQARPLFGPLVNKALGLDRLDVASVSFTPGSDYMVARTTDTTVPEGRIFVAPLKALGQPEVAWTPVATAADKITEIALRGDDLFYRTYQGAPRGKLMRLKLAEPVLAKATLALAEPATGVLTGFELGKQALYAEVYQGFTTRVLRHAIDAAGRVSPQGQDVAAGFAGSAALVSDLGQRHDDVWFATRSWTEPGRVMRSTTPGHWADTGLQQAERPKGAPAMTVSEVMVPSHDGVKVPMAVLHRKGLKLDGSHPTLLVGYGAYGFSMNAGFDPRAIAWFERDGVLALINVRGSGAYGDAWYRAGFKATKRNTWLDGVAGARWLIAQGYASPKTLGIEGTSAGGIFVGRAVTTAPELFAAAIFDVGVMDAVRAEESANGITNISEFGSYKNPTEFPALLEMSTYHQIKDGVAYPAVMLIHGLNDPRVDVWHSAKAAARLQAASSSGKPVIMRLDGQAGHGMGSTAGQRASQLGDIYSFLLWQFGKLQKRD
jgi:prolyl oligopeptidase